MEGSGRRYLRTGQECPPYTLRTNGRPLLIDNLIDNGFSNQVRGGRVTQFLASFVLVISICSGRLLSFASTGDRSKDGKLPLAQGWMIQSSAKTKVYPDPYFGKNLRSIPGTTYPIGKNFSNLPMPANSPFAVPWWYRTEFQ